MNKKNSQDPLVQILEKHLFRSSTEGEPSAQVVEVIVDDYMQLLLAQGVFIPQAVKPLFVEDLKEEVRDLIVKRTNGSILPPAQQSSKIRAPRKIA